MPRLLSLGLLAGFVLCTSRSLDSELPVVQHRQLRTLNSTCSVYSTANTTSKESVLTYVCLAVPTGAVLTPLNTSEPMVRAGANDHFKVYLLHRDTSYLAFEQGVPYACENLDCDLDRAGTAYETPTRVLAAGDYVFAVVCLSVSGCHFKLNWQLDNTSVDPFQMLHVVQRQLLAPIAAVLHRRQRLQLQRLGLLDRADTGANDTYAPGSNIDTDTDNSPATRDIKHDATRCMG